MRSILVMNAKGGSGKTTMAINLASYYAVQGREVALGRLGTEENQLQDQDCDQNPADVALVQGANLQQRHLAQQLHVFEHAPGAEHHRGERIVRQDDR